jgi:hypothetical protein
MLPIKGLLLASASLLIAGCASLVTAFKNDPLQHYDMVGPTVYTMTGDRRTAVALVGPNGGYRFCAESLPDAVAVFTASSKAKLLAEGKFEAGLDEATAAGLLQTFQRTEIAEVYRQLGWNTCMAWAQGAIDNTSYANLLSAMVAGGIDIMKVRASQPQVFPTTTNLVVPAGSTVTPAPTPSPSPKPSPTPTPAPSPSPSGQPK